MLSILYEDNHIIVVIKPDGLESQSGKSFAPDMVSEIRKHLAGQSSTRYPQINKRNIHSFKISTATLCRSYPQTRPSGIWYYGICQESQGCSFT